MAKSTIQLPNGTVITIEGSVDEIKKVINVYDGKYLQVGAHVSIQQKKKSVSSPSAKKKGQHIDVVNLVNGTKESEDFTKIENKILNKASQVDRVLLPMYMVDKQLDDTELSSSDIYKFLKEFGINMALPNVSRTLSGPAKNYVMADSVRKRGTNTLYKISRKGKQYIDNILSK